jgi:ABC-type glycerol-3-phosphate transport system substrate-binding protein
MQIKVSKLIALALVVAVLFGLSGVPRATSAQAAYVKTLDLKLPAADGVFKGVDPKGTKITWWHQHTGARETAVKTIVDKFNKENPWGIVVTPVSKGSYNDIFTAATAGIQTGELPEILVAYGNQAAAYQNNEVLADMEPFVKDAVVGIGDDFTKDMFTGFFASDLNAAHNNARLGFSTYRSMESLFYNVDALKELGFNAPPKTWKEFEDIVCKFTQADKTRDGYQIRTDASFIAAGAFAQGGDIYDAKEGKFIYDSPEAKVLPQVMQDLLKKGCVKKTTDPKTFSDQAAFGNSAAVFFTGSSSGIPFVWDAIKKAPKHFVFDIAPIPYKDKPIQDVYGASNSLVSKGKSPQQIMASWLFLRWFSEVEPQAMWSKGTNYFPVRRSTAANLEDIFKAEGTGRPFKSAFDLLGSTKEEPSVDVYQTVRTEAGKTFNNILDGASVDEEMAKLNELANKLLDESRAKAGK